MRLPVPDPGTPDVRSAGRYLSWLAGQHAGRLALAIAFGLVWMGGKAVVPAVIGRALDAGVAGRDSAALASWTGVLVGLTALQAGAGVARHRFAAHVWLGAVYRTVQLVVRRATALGSTLSKRMATGEVVTIGTADVTIIGSALEYIARGVGGVFAILTVAVLIPSMPLGLAVLIGVPVVMAATALLFRPLQRRHQAYREQEMLLTGYAWDVIAGLRVLRGTGGEPAFAARYRAASGRLREAGGRVARLASVLYAAQVLLPGLLVALITWLGARLVLDGAITVGQLVSGFAYAVFLREALVNVTETVDRFTTAHVAARRVVRMLSLSPEWADPTTPARLHDTMGDLVDAASGLVIRPRVLTAVVAQGADAVAIAERLGRYADGAVTLGGVPLAAVDRATIRRHVLVAENEAHLFSGRLRDDLDPAGTAGGRRIAAALHTADADDIVAGLPGGLDAKLVDRGRELSGGQRQRLRLVRALLADPPILVLVEPTNAVDAHTESRISQRLAAARRGRTTVVCTTSPQLLAHADRVVFVERGQVAVEGTHRELLDLPRYRATVAPEADVPAR